MANSSKAKETKTPKVPWTLAAQLSRAYMEKGYNIMFTGMPGIGKTALVELVCNQAGWDMVTFHPVISDPTDFKGMPWLFTDDKGENHCVWVPFDQLEALVKATKKTICFFDDLGQAPVSVQAAGMQLFHGGKINGIKISKHVSFVACTNRKQDRAGVSGILEPVKSRFHGIWELVPELEPWLQYQITEGMSPLLVAFMRHRPEWLTGGELGWKPESDIVNQPCPRTIEHMSDAVNMKLSPVELRPTAYAGAVGKPMANEYYAFEQLLTRMPDLDVVCNNPHGADTPQTPDVAYAMIGALHVRADRANLDNIYTYIGRAFSKELQAIFHFDLGKINKNLMQHQSYIRWASQNGNIFTN